MHRRPTMLRGATGPVRVERDDAGVVHVSADDLGDAMLGLGYCHAVDRGLQILFVRTLGRGRGEPSNCGPPTSCWRSTASSAA